VLLFVTKTSCLPLLRSISIVSGIRGNRVSPDHSTPGSWDLSIVGSPEAWESMAMRFRIHTIAIEQKHLQKLSTLTCAIFYREASIHQTYL